MHRKLLLPAALAGIAGLGVTLGTFRDGDAAELPLAAAGAAGEVTEAGADLEFTRLEDPARTVVEDADGEWVATFTDGSHSVAVAGPERTFDEPTATSGVTTDVWVRVLPEPFAGEVDEAWLEAALADESADALAIATEYFTGAPDVFDEDGVLIAGDASYGPLQPDGSRPVGADWNDFQARDVSYPGAEDPAEPEEDRSLDCSGYTRTIFGVRLGLPMSLRPDGGASLPRRSFEQAAEAPGVAPITDGALDPEKLQAGDLVFMDSPNDSDDRIDHVGMYVGIDDAGNHRFLHSRPSADGPTIGGDDKHPSILDGDGYYARGFVSTRRL